MKHFQFDVEQHRYTLRGTRLPSVTGILHDAGLCSDLGWSDHARWRGSQVARATQFYDENDLDLRTLSQEIKGYVDGWIAVRRAFGFQILAIEKHVYSRRYGYAGTLDRIVRMLTGPFARMKAILDIKSTSTGRVPFHARYQTAGYGAAEKDSYAWPRLACALHPDGSYSWESYGPETFHADLADFLAARRVAALRRLQLESGDQT